MTLPPGRRFASSAPRGGESTRERPVVDSHDPRRAIVLFSGGQDSTTCLAWALERYEHVETIGFDYGQRHRIELDCRGVVRDELLRAFPQWAGKLGDDHLLDLKLLGQISDSALALKAMQLALSLGLDKPMTVETPLMWLTKAQTWALAQSLGGDPLTALIVEHTHTCYLRQRGDRFAWGHGCGQCPACALRAAGHAAWLDQSAAAGRR